MRFWRDLDRTLDLTKRRWALGTSLENIEADTRILLQIEVGHGRKAIVIFVPVPLLQGFHKVQQR